jgi:hypothetical protein
VKESGHNRTFPRTPWAAWPRPANQEVKVCSAKAGISRSGVIPPSRFASGSRARRLTSRGAREANRDDTGSQPIDQCDRGRAQGRRA